MKNDNEKLIKLAGLILEKIGKESHPIAKVWDLKLSEVQKIMPMFFKEADNLLSVLKERGILNNIDNRYDKLEELSPDLLTPTKDADIVFSFEVNIQKLNNFINQPYTDFDINKKSIIYGEKECFIPPGSLEEEMCRFIFDYPVGKYVEWQDIAEKIESEPLPKRREGETMWPKDKEQYYQAIKRINKKVKKDLGIVELFQYKNDTFVRTE